ncbi:hypothetical protein PV10_08524 [Exophiala mesophila]|uniref:Nuclear envelope protein n=1 Tax=Exophiala mesophila TaxID=212818 RepID=A0A0D1ZQ24_EXOME|nr:uncharacterized protein PV10_08524 [Exophiala mesophila]KIV88893.1 hypothetical protein PV10_08524 [Exophiala mesophila]
MATPTPPSPRSYRRYLTSALHTRFVHAALFSFGIALHNVFWIGGERDLIWSWLPVGPAGIKALVFSLSSFLIFVLQIATLAIGSQTTASHFSTFRKNSLSFAAVQTYGWYLASAWWFSEAYIWSSPDLSWVTKNHHGPLDRLNERPIFFRFYASVLALCAATLHLYQHRSTLHFPISKLPSTPKADEYHKSTHVLDPVQSQIWRKVIPFTLESASVVAVSLILSPFIYNYFFRGLFWSGHLFFAKLYFNISRADETYSGYPPLGKFLLHSGGAGFLLMMTWQLSTFLFLTSMAQEPTKSGYPLSRSSKDPNGTLLSGLKAKRDVVKTFAYWELAIIAQKHKDRRQAIFEDIERPTGPMWTQMQQPGLRILQNIVTRIDDSLRTAAAAQTPARAGTLPRIVGEASAPSIYAPTPRASLREYLVSNTLRDFGSSQKPFRPPVKEIADAVGKSSFSALLRQWLFEPSSSCIAWLFSSTRAAKINALVLGTPNGNAALLVDIIESITKMLVASLGEDTYGRATPTVPETVTVFTKTLTAIEDLMSVNQGYTEGEIEEVEIVVQRLRGGLRELLAAFQLYLIDVGLGIAELNQAKRAIEEPKSNGLNGSSGMPLLKESQQEERSRKAQTQQRQQREPAKRAEQEQAKGHSNDVLPSSGSFGRTNSNRRLFPRREMQEVR